MSISERDLSLIREKFVDESSFLAAVERVEKGEPLAYVLGEWYFYGLTFKLNRDCLIPRPDTEHIVEKAIALLPRGGRFIDLCSGSGCIGISVLHYRPDAVGDALEISPDAYAVSVENAKMNGVSERYRPVCGDLFKHVPTERYDCVISNPPYICSSVIPTLDTSVKDHEPLRALDGGENGMEFYRFILKEYREHLKEGGCFIFEIGYDQREAITALALEFGYGYCRVTKDYGGNDRVAVIKENE
jgi:release factor glutamine methyltransferase